VIWAAKRLAGPVKRLLNKVMTVVVGGIVGFVAGVWLGGWAGLGVALLGMSPEVAMVVSGLLRQRRGIAPAGWSVALAQAWRDRSPFVLARLGFLVGAAWLLFHCGTCGGLLAMVVPPIGGDWPGPRAHAIAYDARRQRVEMRDETLAAVLTVLRERGRARAIEDADGTAMRVASPSGLWLDPGGLSLRLVDELNERLAVTLDGWGLEPIAIVYLTFPGQRVVYADRALFLGRIQHLPEPVRRFAERHEYDHASHPDPDHAEADIWAADPPEPEVDAHLVELSRAATRGVFEARRVRGLVDDAVRQVEAALLEWELGRVGSALWLLEPAWSMIDRARRDLADPDAWTLRVDERVSLTLAFAELRAGELLDAMRTPAVLHSVGHRAWAIVEHEPDGQTVNQLARRISAPTELVRVAVASHPGLDLERVDDQELVTLSPGLTGRRVPTPPAAGETDVALRDALASDGPLVELARPWLVGEYRSLRDAERSGWLAELATQVLRGSPKPVAVGPGPHV
jgi:hypothetical protein